MEAEPLWKGADTYVAFELSTGKYLGAFVLDAFARDGKTKDFLVSTISGLIQHPHGTIERPFVLLATSFTPPSDGKPPLLTFEEVWTLFHEFGHVLHSLATEQKHYSLGPEGGNGDVME